MTRRGQKAARLTRIRRVELGILVATCLAMSAWAVIPRSTATAGPVDEPVFFVDDEQELDFSRFDHRSAEHARMPCLLCHKRAVGLTRPTMPGHMPCAGCHVTQFADNNHPICTICHTATSVKPFPR